MKKIICSIALIAGSLLSTGIFISCGDQFPEEYPWMIGDRKRWIIPMRKVQELLTLRFLKKELRGAIPFMINYSHEPGGNWEPHDYQYGRANNIDNYSGD